MTEQPLAGVTVLDFGQIYNGPYCGFLLAMAGARVIKVESPQGESLRGRSQTSSASYPFAMLVNQSPRHGRFLSVRLRGVVSDREAIGATVRVTAKGKTWSRQLVGGDGFVASNERVLTFGLGEAESIDSISVAWPAGTDEVFQEAVPTDSELLLVEGSRRIVFLHRNP